MPAHIGDNQAFKDYCAYQEECIKSHERAYDLLVENYRKKCHNQARIPFEKDLQTIVDLTEQLADSNERKYIASLTEKLRSLALDDSLDHGAIESLMQEVKNLSNVEHTHVPKVDSTQDATMIEALSKLLAITEGKPIDEWKEDMLNKIQAEKKTKMLLTRKCTLLRKKLI